MTNAELISKIKAEINYRIEIYIGHAQSCIGTTRVDGLEEVLDFLSTLESEKPINLDDAMKELDEKIALVKRRGTWDGVDVDKYMDEVRGRAPEKPINQEDELNGEIKKFVAEYGYERSEDILLIAIVARHFTDWQKEQMMREAIGGNAYPNDGEIWVDLARYGYKFKEGEPCRIIIVKEDEQ